MKMWSCSCNGYLKEFSQALALVLNFECPQCSGPLFNEDGEQYSRFNDTDPEDILPSTY